MRYGLKERLAGFALMIVIVPLAVLGYLLIVYIGFFGKTERSRAGARALDHFVNATLFKVMHGSPVNENGLSA